MGYWEFHNFFENLELEGTLSDKMCKGCEADECDDCFGHTVNTEISDQIYDEALTFIKTLAKEWSKLSVEGVDE